MPCNTSTGSPSPWSTVTRGTLDAKGLYMNSTLALNPDTGKLVWHYQHIGADPYDQDYAFERIVDDASEVRRYLEENLDGGELLEPLWDCTAVPE